MSGQVCCYWVRQRSNPSYLIQRLAGGCAVQLYLFASFGQDSRSLRSGTVNHFPAPCRPKKFSPPRTDLLFFAFTITIRFVHIAIDRKSFLGIHAWSKRTAVLQ